MRKKFLQLFLICILLFQSSSIVVGSQDQMTIIDKVDNIFKLEIVSVDSPYTIKEELEYRLGGYKNGEYLIEDDDGSVHKMKEDEKFKQVPEDVIYLKEDDVIWIDILDKNLIEGYFPYYCGKLAENKFIHAPNYFVEDASHLDGRTIKEIMIESWLNSKHGYTKPLDIYDSMFSLTFLLKNDVRYKGYNFKILPKDPDLYNQLNGYSVMPSFYGSYAYRAYFEEQENNNNNSDKYTYDDYYFKKGHAVPFDVESVLLINGNYIPREFPVIKNNISLVPIRTIVERLDGKVEWDEKQKKITINKNNVTLELFIDKSSAIVNGKTTKLSVPPQILNGKAYMPLRFVAEQLNAEVSFQKGDSSIFPNIISITQKDSAKKINFSKEKSLGIVKEIFSNTDWGEGLKQNHGNIYNKLNFSIQETPFSNFWVIDIKLDDDFNDFTRISVWVDMYTGDLYSKYSGYEGVFGLYDGVENAVIGIKYQLLY